MAKTKVAVSIDAKLVIHVDRLVRSRQFANRSAAIETALTEKLVRLGRLRLTRECAKFDPRYERVLAEAGLPVDLAALPVY